MYPHLLVFAQFSAIAAMVWLGRGIVTSPWGLAVFVAGVAVGFWALAHNRPGNFHIRPELRHGCEMVHTGPYRFVRHPMYTSVLLMMAGVLVSTPTLAEAGLYLMLFIVLTLKARREERLWCGHDPRYGEYRRTTKMFVPGLW
jgi:protein-S-isoprenylcysteine O-methyltransferase Ste14